VSLERSSSVDAAVRNHPLYSQAVAAMDSLPSGQIKPELREQTAMSLTMQMATMPEERRLPGLQGLRVDANGTAWASDRTDFADPTARVQKLDLHANDPTSMQALSQRFAELAQTERAPSKDLAASLQQTQIASASVPSPEDDKKAPSFAR
jgi:hypothetical protein